MTTPTSPATPAAPGRRGAAAVIATVLVLVLGLALLVVLATRRGGNDLDVAEKVARATVQRTFPGTQVPPGRGAAASQGRCVVLQLEPQGVRPEQFSGSVLLRKDGGRWTVLRLAREGGPEGTWFDADSPVWDPTC